MLRSRRHAADRRRRIHAKVRRKVATSMEGCRPKSSQKCNALWHCNQRIYAFATALRLKWHPTAGRVNPLHFYRSLFALSASHTCVLSWISFVILPSRSSVLINVFVFDIFRIPSRCSQICSGSLHPLASSQLQATLRRNRSPIPQSSILQLTEIRPGLNFTACVNLLCQFPCNYAQF